MAPVLHRTGVMPESGLTYLLIANFTCLVVIAIHLSDIKKLFRDIVGELSIRQHLESINRHLDGLGRQLTSIDDGVNRTKGRLDNIKLGIYNDTIASTVQELDSALTNMSHIVENMEYEK